MREWNIIARHKWVKGAIITELHNADFTQKRFVAAIKGWRNFKLWEGKCNEVQKQVKNICDKVKEIIDRMETGDDSVFFE